MFTLALRLLSLISRHFDPAAVAAEVNGRSRLRRLRRLRAMEVLALIVGLGTDLIEIERIEQSIRRFGDAFLHRVYTAGEIAYCTRKKNAAESFAARFAAKEAGAKALGTGISRGVNWREFEVRRVPGMRPELHLSGRAEELARALGVRRISLSLSHSRSMSIAVAVAEDGR